MAGTFLAACASLGLSAFAPAQELDLGLVFDQRKVEPMRELLNKGDYANVAKLCSIFIENGQPSPDWWIMRVQADVALGAVDDIVAATESALQKHKENLRVLMTCHEALTAYGEKIGSALDDVAADVGTLVVTGCPECGAEHVVAVDPFGLNALRGGHLYREVHALASRYHWSEADILALPRARRRLYLSLLDEEQGRHD